jgi:hypothetical protein
MESIRQSYINTVNELNQELLAVKDAYEQLDAEKEFLNRELEKRSADANHERGQQTTSRFLSFYKFKREIYLFQKKYHRICSNNRSKRYVLLFIYRFILCFIGSYSY